MSSFRLELPDDLEQRAAAQAQAAGLGLGEYIASALADRVAQAEADRFMASRATRSRAGQAREILARAGLGNAPRPGDEMD